MQEVTIVIPNYNGRKYLVPCLEALYANTEVEVEVLVIDNHSADGSVERAKELYPNVKFVLLDSNYGFCRAVNEGIKAAHTPYILLLNNDTEVKKGFVESLLRRMKSDKRIFSVEAKMLQYHNPGLIDSAGTFYNALGWAFARGKDDSSEKYSESCNTFAACAGAALYRKSVFKEIGLFDERHFAYLEDIDIGYRARIFGYTNVYEPKAEVIHVGSASSGSRYNEFKIRYSARNNIYLIYKNMPLLQIVINVPLFVIGFGVKAIFFYKKGFGKLYLKSLKDGFDLCDSRYKVRYEKKNLKNYCRIQIELLAGIVRKLAS